MSASALAGPFSVEADAGERIGVNALYTRAASTVAWQRDRWHLGVRVAFAGVNAIWVAEQDVEAGVVLHASSKLDVLWIWRAGHAYIHDGTAGVMIGVHALALETAASLVMKLGDYDLRIAPLVISEYRAGLGLITIGPEVGIARRF